MNQENIRNFVIISHIDHGKSTLADRFLEITKTVDSRKMQPQYLDRMALERERGITIKMQPCRMIYHPEIRNSKSEARNKSKIQNSNDKNSFGFRNSNFELANLEYILNLIDTPGHVDFSYEVSRSLAAVEGAILLVDATKGIQAQTIANLEMALKEKLVIIPAINKIDIAIPEQIEQTRKELSSLLETHEQDIHLVSAKTGKNVEELLKAAIKRVPAPAFANPSVGEAGASTGESADKGSRALIFDSEYDFYKGVVVYVKVVDGQVKKGDKIYLMGSKTRAEAIEVGHFKPELVSVIKLEAGEIGYIATGLKDIEKCRVGDTVTRYKLQDTSYKPEPLKGYQKPQSMVFASFYPVNADDYNQLKDGLGKLKLTDASLVFEGESIPALGRGFRCGFLGMLHLEIISERLKRDYGLELVITSPSVAYKKDKQIEEPWIKMEIILPVNYLGSVMKLLETLRGAHKNTKYLGQDKLIIEFEAPLDEIIAGFYDKLKSVSSGYGSMSYILIGYREGNLEKLDILLAGDKIDAFSKIIPKQMAYRRAKKMVKLLKEVIPPQQFAVPIQAVVGGKIIARETKKAMRKDVISGLYGGDYTRKKKLLEKQKKGKKKLTKFGKVNLPSEVFLKILKQR